MLLGAAGAGWEGRAEEEQQEPSHKQTASLQSPRKRGGGVFSGGEEGEMGSRKCPEPPAGSRGLAHLVSQATS